ncbi:penicillin-binding protein 2 [Calidifontimicrobium sp. SYSU G02091]|uniref:penicillin-binding protein 2 n=1 Tax=Calidifontimicrobium sp. SYSU G02091 TaxID=2926421 RepID=UPI001F538B71|nr:penicillin-binding protein 2 [Calidifontimicrobium sp. SYSU G02091]MCI1190395.1 penicillin-binding protein 2 [Calidifontimicrobium sp. SYSU G02091]
MAELKNVELELHRFRGRVLAAAAFVLLGLALLAARMVYLQVIRHDELATRAETNRIAVLPVVPNRGLIVDRHGVVLASNYSAYTLEITPSKVGDVEATIDALAQIVEIRPSDRRRFKRLREEGKSFDSIPIRTKLSDEEVARFTAQRWRFPGVEVNARLFRSYPLGETGSHMIGYIGRINAAEKKAMEDWDEETQANYRGTEYIGKLGLEQSYEAELHGTTGYAEVETTAGGRAVRQLRSHPPTPGNTLVLSVDIRLQWLVEQLFGDRRGALVAIDPRNGEVLAFVSKPTFDPNLFVDGIDHDSWRELNESIDKPLLNRALRGTYPPGSTFKPFMAMAALTSGKRSPNTVIHDGGTFNFGGHLFRSHGDTGLGPVDMRRSIVKSSNVYYYSLANEMGVDLMHEHLSPFGFGARTGIDLHGEVTGVLPSTQWKRRTYKRPEQQRWYAGETISLGIGQGYNSFTMLQIAQAMATLASGGQRFEPRLVREIEDVVSGARRPVERRARPPLALNPAHVQLVLDAMYGVTQEGTSTRVFAGAPYKSGGKTGTAQAVGIRQNEKYNAAKLAEHQRDHSLYVAFAPLEAPTIALAVIVENAGFGAAAAAPIARRVFDYWLLGLFPSDEDIALTREGRSTAPVGTPRRADEVPLPGLTTAPVAAAPAAHEPRHVAMQATGAGVGR